MPNQSEVIAYVPTRPRTSRERLDVEMKPLPGGGFALLVYTSLDRLLSCLGSSQPWAGLTENGLAEVKRVTHYREMLIDQRIPEEMRYTSSPANAATISHDGDEQQGFQQSWMVSALEPGTKRRR